MSISAVSKSTIYLVSSSELTYIISEFGPYCRLNVKYELSSKLLITISGIDHDPISWRVLYSNPISRLPQLNWPICLADMLTGEFTVQLSFCY